jgi:hypothetical protein
VNGGASTRETSAVDIRKAFAFSINGGRASWVEDDYLFDAQKGYVGFRKAP